MARFLYVGSRRKGPSSWSPPPAGDFGIGIHRYDPATGTLTDLGRAAPDLSVGFLLHDPRRGVLYALHEAMTLPDCKRGGGGMVAAFRIGPDGGLTEIARSPSFGSLPCHATLDPDGRHLLVVHHTGHTPVTRTVETPAGYQIVLDYDQAATVLFPLDDAGGIGPPRPAVRPAPASCIRCCRSSMSISKSRRCFMATVGHQAERSTGSPR